MANEFKQIFGYSPLEEWNSLSDWQKKGGRGATMSPLVDAQIGYMSQQQTNEASRQLAQQQNDFNMLMWHEQNLYNSPKATMQRLVEAGINPRAYQQIGQFANASQPHKAERPEYDSPLGKLAKFSERAQIELAYKQLNLDKIRLSTDTLNATADKINAFRTLNELSRHNKANEANVGDRNLEISRHNYEMEGISKNVNALNNARFRYELQSMGVKFSYDESSGNWKMSIPQWLITANMEEKINYVEEIKKRILNLEEDNKYKQGLNNWYEANQVLGNLAKLLGLLK